MYLHLFNDILISFFIIRHNGSSMIDGVNDKDIANASEDEYGCESVKWFEYVNLDDSVKP